MKFEDGYNESKKKKKTSHKTALIEFEQTKVISGKDDRERKIKKKVYILE